MDIMDFSFNAKTDYGKGNRINLKELAKASEKDSSLSNVSINKEEMAALEKELCACSYVQDAQNHLGDGFDCWHHKHLRYFEIGIIAVSPSLDNLWNKRFQKIHAGHPTLKKTPNPMLRLLMAVLSILFFAAAACVICVPDLRMTLLEDSALSLIIAVGIILVPVSLIFSFMGLIIAVGILVSIYESAGSWLAQQSAFLQNWLAPLAMALVLAVIGILFLRKYCTMPSRRKAKAAYKKELEAYQEQVKKSVKEAKEYVISCQFALAMQHNRIVNIAKKLSNNASNEPQANPENELLELAIVLQMTTKTIDYYKTYEERLNKIEASLADLR